MPQASKGLTDLIIGYFGEPDDNACMTYLTSQGYVLGSDWRWTHPTIKKYKDMSEQEWHCLSFLVEEWDFGGLNES